MAQAHALRARPDRLRPARLARQPRLLQLARGQDPAAGRARSDAGELFLRGGGDPGTAKSPVRLRRAARMARRGTAVRPRPPAAARLPALSRMARGVECAAPDARLRLGVSEQPVVEVPPHAAAGPCA